MWLSAAGKLHVSGLRLYEPMREDNMIDNERALTPRRLCLPCHMIVPPGQKNLLGFAVITMACLVGAGLLSQAEVQRIPSATSRTMDSVAYLSVRTDPMNTHKVVSESSGRCLDSADNIVRLVKCDTSSPNQMWAYDDGHLRAHNGRCLDEGGRQVHIWKCSEAGVIEQNQHWKYDEETAQIQHVASDGKCLVASLDGNAPSMKPCDVNSEEQKWHVHVNTLPKSTQVAMDSSVHSLHRNGWVHAAPAALRATQPRLANDGTKAVLAIATAILLGCMLCCAMATAALSFRKKQDDGMHQCRTLAAEPGEQPQHPEDPGKPGEVEEEEVGTEDASKGTGMETAGRQGSSPSEEEAAEPGEQLQRPGDPGEPREVAEEEVGTEDASEGAGMETVGGHCSSPSEEAATGRSLCSTIGSSLAARMAPSVSSHEAPSSGYQCAVLWLHGLCDTGDGWRGAFPVKGPRFYHPTAPKRPVTCNDLLCMTSWFDIQNIPVDFSEPENPRDLASSVASMHQMLHGIEKSGIAAENIVLGGFSQGGTVSLSAGLSYPKKLAGIICISGWCAVRTNVDWISDAGRETPVLMTFGDSDPVVHFSITRTSADLLKEVLGGNFNAVCSKRGMHHPNQDERTAVISFMQQHLPVER